MTPTRRSWRDTPACGFALYSWFAPGPPELTVGAGVTGKHRRFRMKKVLGLFGLVALIAAAVAFFRRSGDDDDFLDEELE